MDASPLPQLAADRRLHLLVHSGPAQPLALRLGAPESSLHPLHDHGPLELGEDAEHLEHGLASRRRGVEPLLVEVEIDALARSSPRRVTSSCRTVRGGPPTRRPPGRPPSAPRPASAACNRPLGRCPGHARVTEHLHYRPAVLLGHRFQLPELVLDRLPVGADPGVQGHALHRPRARQALAERCPPGVFCAQPAMPQYDLFVSYRKDAGRPARGRDSVKRRGLRDRGRGRRGRAPCQRSAPAALLAMVATTARGPGTFHRLSWEAPASQPAPAFAPDASPLAIARPIPCSHP
jgi:hypothetical protein